jgi:amphi-Trp domain-containing protein
MDLIEIKQKERLGREEVAARLHELADQLARHNDVEFEQGGTRIRAHVPDEVDFKVEFEIDDDGTELELELPR